MNHNHDKRSDQTGGPVVSDIEASVLTILFAALIILGLVHTVLRLAGVPLAWAEEAMRALLLWLVMAGAVAAAGSLRHVRIELLDKLVSARTGQFVQKFGFMLTGLTCAALAWTSLQYVALQYEFGQLAFLVVPVWMVQFAMPAGFALMAVRFASLVVAPGGDSVSRGAAER